MSTFEQLRDQLICEQYIVDRVGKQLKAARHNLEKAERALVDWMLESDTSSFKHQGATFYLLPKFHFRANRANREEIEQWLESRGIDTSDLREVTFRRAPMKELLKGIYEQEGPDALPAFLAVDTTPGVSIRGKSNLATATNGNEDDDEEES
jgi:hypothetical protein